MAGIDYYHCAKCDVKMLYVHSEESECEEMYCGRCYNQLEAENDQLKQSCEDHAEYAKQRLEKLQEAEADNKRLHALLRDINQYTSRIVEQALNKP